jgi:hypothetical protein
LFDRSVFKNICLLGVLIFLVLSSGALQCAYTCMEDDAARRASSRYEVHASSHITGCHLKLPEPKQITSCTNHSCHQTQAASRSLGGAVLTNNTGTPEPLLNGVRVPLPDLRVGQSFKQKELPQPVLLASWHPPTTVSQTLMGVRTTVLLN